MHSDVARRLGTLQCGVVFNSYHSLIRLHKWPASAFVSQSVANTLLAAIFGETCFFCESMTITKKAVPQLQSSYCVPVECCRECLVVKCTISMCYEIYCVPIYHVY